MADAATTTVTPSAGGMSTTTMALIAVAVLVFGAFLYTKMKASPAAVAPKMGSGADGSAPVVAPGPDTSCKSSDFVNCAAVAKRKAGNYAAYSGSMTPANVNGFYGTSTNLFGAAKDDKGLDWNAAYAWAFLIGLNLDATASNLQIFKSYIQEYINNPSHLANWEVKPGQFLA